MFGKYEEIYRLAQPYLATRNNELHTQVAYRFALKLIEAEGGNEEVVLPAVILHDVGWKAVPEDLHLKAFGPGFNDMEINRIHEVEGARIARQILEQVGYDPVLTDRISEIIFGHDSRTEPLSDDDAIVKDSDKLWRFSEPALEIDPVRFGIDPKIHLAWLKDQIDGWFITKTARATALLEVEQRAECLEQQC